MITADTSVFIDFFRGGHSKTADLLQRSLDSKQLLMNPFVLSELLSSPKLSKKIAKYLLDIPRIEIDNTFFERAGLLRRQIYIQGKGVPIADIYIAQACISASVPILTADQDFLMISEHSQLNIVDV